MAVHLECLSHTPLQGLVDPAPEVMAEVEAVLSVARARVAAFAPELVILFSPDHYNGFFYDLMPAWCVGIEARSIGDFLSAAGRLNVPGDLALDLARSTMAAGFDTAISYRMEVDHGFAYPLEALFGGLDTPPVIPVFVNSIAVPMPAPERVRRFGAAIGDWAARTGKRVLVVGSGGISHEPPVPELATAAPDARERLIAWRNPPKDQREARQARTIRAGRESAAGTSSARPLNPAWDRAFLDLMKAGRVEAVDGWSDDWISAEGGRSAHEIRTWWASFAALKAAGGGTYSAEIDYYRAIPEWIAGFAVMHGDIDGTAGETAA
ncbi:MAG: 3-carboxyethylcatechol 2,3-dioxygenase [Phyllobacteriaceae bacterium]|nr:3-carboxyethylcatechol 2,3-dioxygenase [Phyllobacteriaceae bacterium]